MIEILNIEYHTIRLIIKALNSNKFKVEAAKALGISEKTLYNLIIRYKIFKEKGKYTSPKRDVVTVKLLCTA